MGVIATVPALPGAAVNHKRSYASYPQSGADTFGGNLSFIGDTASFTLA